MIKLKKVKFKSLTMRIWVTFTAIILIIILSISIIYLVAFRSTNEKYNLQLLKASHDTFKENNFNQLKGFDDVRNLHGSSHFIVNVDSSNTINIQDFNKRGGPPGQPNMGFPPNSGVTQDDIQKWMAGFIENNNISENEFKESYHGRKFLFIISSVNNIDGTNGKSYLISYMPAMEDNTLLYMVIGIGIMFIVFGFIAAKLVASHIAKPLKALEDYTVRIAHKDWKEPIQIKNEDEIGRLANSMNLMRTELKRADEEEKMFLQSISHDLKTPVMVIMSHAEAIIDGIYIDSIEKTAGIIRDEAVNLEKKIKQLLYLNTLDYVLENNSQVSKINLRQLLLYIINRFEVVNSKIYWDLDMEDCFIIGNSDKIQVSVENILENSLRYAEEKISVILKEENSSVILEIYNDGPNIDDKHINHIFDNHYKDKTGNFGLGLAISKKIIDFYNGKIEAVNREKGVSFIIKAPTA
ncbi:MAG: HAMP domain-containing sensor histidine kinase [Clostridium sp.]|uniref:sensor histidine kinase n=1 Tax=Clostridium sp. TaxID=1506 RepID=UPI0039E74272